MPPPWPWFSALAFGVSLRMAGARQRLDQLATLVEGSGGLEAEPPVREFELLVTQAVVGLLAGRDEDAGRAAGGIPVLPGQDAASPEDGEALGAMLTAVLTRDQPALDAAATARSQARMAREGRSSENRARLTFLLDRTVLAVMVEACPRV